jgi:Fe2+ transport system protein FeoA
MDESGVITRVKVRDEARLEYLAEHEFFPGTSFTIRGKAPFDGPIRLQIQAREQVLGSDLAEKIRAQRVGG